MQKVTYGPDTFRFAREGDVVTIDGRKHKLVKKTSTAVAVRRHYWFDEMYDRLALKLGRMG